MKKQKEDRNVLLIQTAEAFKQTGLKLETDVEFPCYVIGVTKQGLAITSKSVLFSDFEKSRHNRLKYELSKLGDLQFIDGVVYKSYEFELAEIKKKYPIYRMREGITAPGKLSEVQPYEHMIVIGKQAIKFIWDTREVTGIIDLPKDFTTDIVMPALDNNKALVNVSDKAAKLLAKL